MKIWLTLAMAVASAAIQTGAASAGEVNEIGIRDVVSVKGTPLVCVGFVSENAPAMQCFNAKKDRTPKPSSFGVAVSDDGSAGIARYGKDGDPELVFTRKPQGGGQLFVAEVGDAFGLAGTSIGCNVGRVRTGPKLYRGIRVLCYRVDGSDFVANSFGVSISHRFAAMFRIDGDGDPGASVKVRKQP